MHELTGINLKAGYSAHIRTNSPPPRQEPIRPPVIKRIGNVEIPVHEVKDGTVTETIDSKDDDSYDKRIISRENARPAIMRDITEDENIVVSFFNNGKLKSSSKIAFN